MNQTFTLVSNQYAFLSRSADNRLLTTIGYDVVGGIPGKSVIARVDAAGTVDTTWISAALLSYECRSAVTVDGSAVWIGADSGIFYQQRSSPSQAAQLNGLNTFALRIFDNQLYAATISGVYRIGEDFLPTNNSGLSAFPLMRTFAYDMFVVDLNPLIIGKQQL